MGKRESGMDEQEGSMGKRAIEERTEHTWHRIQEAPLSIDGVSAFLRTERAGGVCIFLGTTRRWTGGRETRLLEYECYEPMAMTEMARLLRTACDRWAVTRACLLHRTGAVPLCEVSVVAGVSAPHRDTAFAACRYLIDEMKEHVPIWKRERFADGTEAWVPEHP